MTNPTPDNSSEDRDPIGETVRLLFWLTFIVLPVLLVIVGIVGGVLYLTRALRPKEP